MSLVVFMRGVNVGGARRFQPKLLAKDLEHLGAINLGAAGTFVIRGGQDRKALRAEFLSRLPFPAELMICQGSDLLRLAAGSPFPHGRVSRHTSPRQRARATFAGAV